MSEAEKGEIMQQMQNLPPLLQAKAEGFIQGMQAGISCAKDTEKSGEEKEPVNG